MQQHSQILAHLQSSSIYLSFLTIFFNIILHPNLCSCLYFRSAILGWHPSVSFRSGPNKGMFRHISWIAYDSEKWYQTLNLISSTYLDPKWLPWLINSALVYGLTQVTEICVWLHILLIRSDFYNRGSMDHCVWRFCFFWNATLCCGFNRPGRFEVRYWILVLLGLQNTWRRRRQNFRSIHRPLIMPHRVTSQDTGIFQDNTADTSDFAFSSLFL